MALKAGTPGACPACGTELYPVARLRPQAHASGAARALMLIGLLASAAIFIGAALWFRYVVGARRFGGVFGMVALLPAAVPGLILGWAASRLPKSLTLKCPRCPWRGHYRVGRDGHAVPLDQASTPAFERGRGAAGPQDGAFNDVLRSVPPPPAVPAASGGKFDIVADDAPDDEVAAWAYAELATGQSPEDVAAALTASGWEPGQAEALAERARKATRHLRP